MRGVPWVWSKRDRRSQGNLANRSERLAGGSLRGLGSGAGVFHGPSQAPLRKRLVSGRRSLWQGAGRTKSARERLSRSCAVVLI